MAQEKRREEKRREEKRREDKRREEKRREDKRRAETGREEQRRAEKGREERRREEKRREEKKREEKRRGWVSHTSQHAGVCKCCNCIVLAFHVLGASLTTEVWYLPLPSTGSFSLR